MAKMQITSKPVKDVVKKATLPDPVVVAGLEERNGVAGVMVNCFYPLPDDEQIDRRTRMGKNTFDSKTGEGEDNSKTISSVLSIYGKAEAIDLTYEQDGETYGVLDGDGNQIQFNSTIFSRVKGPAAGNDAANSDEVNTDPV